METTLIVNVTVEPGPDRYRYLWLKSITGIDLGQHCASTFIGTYHPEIDRQRINEGATVSIEFEPAEDVLAYYLCGVASTRDWSRNAHLAFVPAEGEGWHGIAGDEASHSERSRLLVTLDGAVPVLGWGEHSIPASEPRLRQPHFRTCRNWQFAHYLATVRGIKSTPTFKSWGRKPTAAN